MTQTNFPVLVAALTVFACGTLTCGQDIQVGEEVLVRHFAPIKSGLKVVATAKAGDSFVVDEVKTIAGTNWLRVTANRIRGWIKTEDVTRKQDEVRDADKEEATTTAIFGGTYDAFELDTVIDPFSFRNKVGYFHVLRFDAKNSRVNLVQLDSVVFVLDKEQTVSGTVNPYELINDSLWDNLDTDTKRDLRYANVVPAKGTKSFYVFVKADAITAPLKKIVLTAQDEKFELVEKVKR